MERKKNNIKRQTVVSPALCNLGKLLLYIDCLLHFDWIKLTNQGQDRDSSSKGHIFFLSKGANCSSIVLGANESTS